jgi:hypothetical protein
LIAAYILIQAEVGKAAIMAAALREMPSAAGPCDAVTRAGVRGIDEPAKRVNSRVRALDGMTRTMNRPAVHR